MALSVSSSCARRLRLAPKAARSHLLLASGCAGKQQIRNVGAGDEQHHDNGAQQRKQGGADVRDRMLFHTNGGDSLRLVISGVGAPEIASNPVESGLRLPERNAGFEAAEHRKRMRAARPCFRRTCEAWVRPNVESRARLKMGGPADKREVARRYAGDCVFLVVQADACTDDCGARAEVLFPHRITEHHGVVFGCPKTAPRAMSTPSRGKKSAVTAAPARRRGSPAPVRIKSG